MTLNSNSAHTYINVFFFDAVVFDRLTDSRKKNSPSNLQKETRIATRLGGGWGRHILPMIKSKGHFFFLEGERKRERERERENMYVCMYASYKPRLKH